MSDHRTNIIELAIKAQRIRVAEIKIERMRLPCWAWHRRWEQDIRLETARDQLDLLETSLRDVLPEGTPRERPPLAPRRRG
jgi:hypothetical protein